MPDDDARYTLIDRETSWLRFGDRVLQEADDPEVPLLERLFFCGVFSSNLDEYFRVRVASLRSLLRLREHEARQLGIDPGQQLREIRRIVLAQQERYGQILGRVLAGLATAGIRIVDDATVDPRHHAFLRSTFEEHVRPRLKVATVGPAPGAPFLRNGGLYLVAEIRSDHDPKPPARASSLALVEVPPDLPRFVTLPDLGLGHHVMFLDDLIRKNLGEALPGHEAGRAWAVKLTRDAELYVEDEFDGDLVEAIRRCLHKREIGMPSRFLHDTDMPPGHVHRLQEKLGLEPEDPVPGARYHNLQDFVAFPRFGRTDLCYPDWPPLPHAALATGDSMLAAVREQDRVMHTPYQSFDPFLRFLAEAADDPAVDDIRLTVYRVGRESNVLDALVRAARAGKHVTVFFEVQARFDEELNLEWADRLAAAGARTLLSKMGLKVHAKLALVTRRTGASTERFTYVGTGNFNEKAARTYADHGIFTSDACIARDAEQVFRFLAGEIEAPLTEQLLVAPFNLRERLVALIDAEAERARAGGPAGITIKLNALEDRDIIERLYDASGAGVPIDLIVRGICRLVPGVPGQSSTIRVRSIVDRYLEHARIYRFHGDGEPRIYLASADWMKRNLAHRVEVAMPVHDPDVRSQLEHLLELQLADNRKARIIDGPGSNAYARTGGAPVRAQQAFREYLTRRGATS